MKRAVVAILAASAVAIALLRRRGLPEYATWADYLADVEGDALPPRDPYLERLR